MKINRMIVFFTMCSLCLTGCTNRNEIVSVSKKPDATETLEVDSKADIFQWDGNLFQTEIDWVDELELVENEKVGEIKFKATSAKNFKNGAANRLPIGAEIYSVENRHDILIVKYDGESKRYLLLSEG